MIPYTLSGPRRQPSPTDPTAMLYGTNLKYTKAHNFRIVLEAIRLYGPLSRADIARRTELTPQTVSNITKRLIEAALVRETHRVQEGRGAPAISLELNAEGAFAIGLDLDQDHLTGVLMDLEGRVRQRISYELAFPPPDEAMDQMEEVARQLMREEGLQRKHIWGVGVGLPGPLEISEGSVAINMVNPKAFPGWQHVPVVEVMSERLALPVYLENNATAAAIGERWYGEGRHLQTFFYLFFGLGLGGGLIINGHPYEGHTGNAGELGCIPVPCPPEREEPFEHPHLGIYFKLPRLYRLLEKDGVPVNRPMDLTPLYERRHPRLMEWLDTGARMLTSLVLTIDYLIDPEAILFGGRLPDALIDDLMERVKRALPDQRIQDKTFVPELRRGRAGADAAALGVATLPMYEAFAPAPNLLFKRTGDGPEWPFSTAQHRALKA